MEKYIVVFRVALPLHQTCFKKNTHGLIQYLAMMDDNPFMENGLKTEDDKKIRIDDITMKKDEETDVENKEEPKAIENKKIKKDDSALIKEVKKDVEKKELNPSLYSALDKSTEDDFDKFSGVRNEVISFELKNFLNKNLTISRVKAQALSRENHDKTRLINGEDSISDKNAQESENKPPIKEKARLTNGEGFFIGRNTKESEKKHANKEENPTKEITEENEERSRLSNGKGDHRYGENNKFLPAINYGEDYEDEYEEGEGNLIIAEEEDEGEELTIFKEDDSFFKQEEEEDYPSMDNDYDEGVYFNSMMDCVILEEGDECLRFDDKPSDSEENAPLPAVNGNYLAITSTTMQQAPVKKRKKRTPSKILNDAGDEDPCAVIWTNPNENGNCKVCRGHCPGPKCRKCQAVEVQGRKRYVCLLCGKTINHMGNFGQHVRSHVSPICHICHKTFKMLRALEQHMQFHRKKMEITTKKRRKQKTPIKIAPTVNVEEPVVGDDGEVEGGDCFLPPNENSMSPPYETNGDICELLQVDILAKTDDIMPNGKDDSHVDSYNDDEEELFDEDGDEVLNDDMDVNEQINAMDLSISTGHGGEIYRCEFCFGTNCQPKKCQKSKVETVEDRTTYECLICGKVIINHKGNFKQHVRSHTDFCCKVCGKKFNDALRLKKHSELHTKKKTYKCDVCPKAFRVPHHLAMHKERAHMSVKKYNCTNCDRVFASRGELMSHIRWSHMGPERPFECELCQKTFAYKNNLKIHMRIHTNDKPYACKVCGRAFTQSSSLKMHMTVHSCNRNVFKCGACDKSFPYASNLKLHVKSAHSGLNPARRKSTTCACQLCGLGFTHRNSLKAHMRTAHPFYDYAKMEEQTDKVKAKPPDHHTKLTSRNDNKYRPHICPTCGRGFTQRGSLSTHMRVLHNSFLIPKPVASKSLPFLATLLPPEISVVFNPTIAAAAAAAKAPATATSVSAPQSRPPEPDPESEPQSTPNRFDGSQFIKCTICGCLFTHYEHLESHICIHTV
ncbi:hypothetical protein LSTR_LSTR003899 [Laodelphax striatellus]|uniref:C2H2-type domain-containing protein n=1 Tax=Laodelphax striatellus TaxID=195883 RepID=A0A482XAF2_LAOST|nr:hypothetical protein LSTR_LSTR003899 [Laodelphax striatellus]